MGRALPRLPQSQRVRDHRPFQDVHEPRADPRRHQGNNDSEGALLTRPIILAFIAGCIVGLCFDIAREDWKARAADGEKALCRDEPDRVAYYARKPGEAHSVESCQHIARYGDPAWVPYMSHPLKGNE